MLQIYIFTSCTNIGLFHNSESWSQLTNKNTLGSPIREIATLRRRFMPPLYFPTSLSATPPANKRTLLKDCSIACKQQIEVVSVSPFYRFCNKMNLVSTSQNTKMTQKFNLIIYSGCIATIRFGSCIGYFYVYIGQLRATQSNMQWRTYIRSCIWNWLDEVKWLTMMEMEFLTSMRGKMSK